MPGPWPICLLLTRPWVLAIVSIFPFGAPCGCLFDKRAVRFVPALEIIIMYSTSPIINISANIFVSLFLLEVNCAPEITEVDAAGAAAIALPNLVRLRLIALSTVPFSQFLEHSRYDKPPVLVGFGSGRSRGRSGSQSGRQWLTAVESPRGLFGCLNATHSTSTDQATGKELRGIDLPPNET